MKNYKEFVNEAVENYEKLPQETSELYKRHYVNIPFDLKSFENNVPADNESLKNALDDLTGKLDIKFDIALGSTDSIVKQNEFVKVETPENANSLFEKRLHSSREDKYVAYINAKSDRLVMIDVPDEKSANINMLMLSSNKPLNATIFIKVGKDSKLNLFEYCGSVADKPTVLGTIHEIHSGDRSNIELNALHNENSNTLSMAFCKNEAGEGSHMRLNSVHIGASYTRVRNVIGTEGKESKIELNEVVFGSGSQKFDMGTRIINIAPHTNASLESKAALMDSSFCILKGFAKINKGAEKAKSYVHERGILLGKNARIEGLPDMSVDENDVKATHSSATAPVDSDSVFYLMSKGIEESGVKKLIVTGFFANSLARIQNNMMKELSMSLINCKLENGIYGTVPKMDARNVWISASDTSETDMFKGHYKYRGM